MGIVFEPEDEYWKNRLIKVLASDPYLCPEEMGLKGLDKFNCETKCRKCWRKALKEGSKK